MTTRESELIELLHKEVKPALGCTEPIAVALAAAKATETLKTEVPVLSEYEVDVEVSGNILKNGMGVGIPGTGMVGLYIASALGAVCGKSEYGLEVLKVNNGAMKDAGISRGFIIQKVNDENMNTIDDLQKVVKKASTSKDPVLYIQGIYPTGKKSYFAVPLENN